MIRLLTNGIAIVLAFVSAIIFIVYFTVKHKENNDLKIKQRTTDSVRMMKTYDSTNKNLVTIELNYKLGK